MVELYDDKVSIKTIRDLGSACYGKQYRYEIEKTPGVMQGIDVEITKYEPFERIAWSLKFDQLGRPNKNTTYIQTTVLVNCSLQPERDCTLLELDIDYEMQTTWWLKLIFHALIRMFHRKICKELVVIRKDIEFKSA